MLAVDIPRHWMPEQALAVFDMIYARRLFAAMAERGGDVDLTPVAVVQRRFV